MTFDEEYFNMGYLDRLSYRDTVIHRLDPRAKVLLTMLFVVTVVSYPKYEVTALLPFFAFPVVIASLSDTPPLLILKKVLLVAPFALFIGIFNPLLDRHEILLWDGFALSAGWISLLSIMLRFLLTISAALLLIATTSFPGICHALERLGLPAAFTAQLLFLYRYIFLLTEEAMRMTRARDLRSFGNRGRELGIFVRLVGQLFIRTVERAERIYQAMLSRGFGGTIILRKKLSFRISDALFIAAGALFFGLLRFLDLSALLGRLILERGL